MEAYEQDIFDPHLDNLWKHSIDYLEHRRVWEGKGNLFVRASAGVSMLRDLYAIGTDRVELRVMMTQLEHNQEDQCAYFEKYMRSPLGRLDELKTEMSLL